jgi:hypothetical protein
MRPGHRLQRHHHGFFLLLSSFYSFVHVDLMITLLFRASTQRESSTESLNGANSRSYTPEQESGAKKIISLSKKSHYDTLGIAKTANDNEIKKAYRKLALKFHPDKNSAPSAEGAFKAISAAFECLSDPRKKVISLLFFILNVN